MTARLKFDGQRQPHGFHPHRNVSPPSDGYHVFIFTHVSHHDNGIHGLDRNVHGYCFGYLLKNLGSRVDCYYNNMILQLFGKCAWLMILLG